MTFLCEPCIAWFSDVARTLRLDSTRELLSSPAVESARWRLDEEAGRILIAECQHQREYNDFIKGEYSCWFCCRFLLFSAGQSGQRKNDHGGDGERSDQVPLSSGIDQVYEVRAELYMGRHLEVDPYHPKDMKYYTDLALNLSMCGRSITFQWYYMCHCDEDDLGQADSDQLECVVTKGDQDRAEASCLLSEQSNYYLRDLRELHESRVSWIRSHLKACTSPSDGCSVRPDPASREFWDVLGRRQTILHEPAKCLPKRLIYIPLEQSEAVRLVETSSIDAETVQYAALSHCWGADLFLVLTGDKYDAFKEALPFSSLGKTFREAIILCRALHIQYIWIDCLCIIQDSPDGADWREEAPRMHEIYGSSLLTIAASSGSAASAGLFRPSNHLIAQAMRVNLPDNQRMYCRETMFRCGKVDLEASPIMRRGWITQELFLSQRVLYWTRNQFVWRCGTSAWSELKQRQKLDDMKHRRTPDDFHRQGFQEWMNMKGVVWGNPITADGIFDMWGDIINEFSGCGLTRSVDRYFALSGLASYVHAVYKRLAIKTRYLAGHWEHDIVSSLCWRKVTPGRIDSLQPDTHIPTWSVLKSCEANSPAKCKSLGISGASEPSPFDARLVEARIEYTHPTQVYGSLRSASLCLNVFIFTLVELDCNAACKSWKTDHVVLRTRGRPDLVWSSDEKDNISLDFCLDSEEFFAKLATPSVALQDEPHAISRPSASIRSLQCALIYLQGVDSLACARIDALVVEKIASQSDGRNVFQRLGQLSWWDYTSDYLGEHKKPIFEWFGRDETPYEEISLV